MKMEMNTEVIVSCAVTGGGDTVGKHPAIPVTPKEIADAAIEAVGRSELVQSAIEVARAGARISVIGLITSEPLEVPFVQGLFAKSLTLRSGIVTPQSYVPRLLPLIEQGRLDPTEIITHRLPLDRAIDGYRTFASHADDVLKVILQP